jgi:hypothetical protein
MILKAQRGTSPVGCRASDGLDDPCRQSREILGHTPIAGCGAWINPGKLAKAVPFVVYVILWQIAPTRRESDDFYAFLRQFVGQDATTSASADDHNNAIVVQFEFCHDRPLTTN